MWRWIRGVAIALGSVASFDTITAAAAVVLLFAACHRSTYRIVSYLRIDRVVSLYQKTREKREKEIV